MAKRKVRATHANEGQSTAAAPGPAALRLSIRKKILFSLITTVTVLLVVEGGLRLAGVRSILLTEDPFIGFAGQLPLFTAERSGNGAEILRTSENKRDAFNVQEFSRRKPAGGYRIFSLGGSTTYGHPFTDPVSFSGWLRELLPVADPSRNWEVINCGGISYASYREAVVLQELTQYEPDLFIIYSAHNEFLERRTYGDLMDRSSVLTAVLSLADRTSTFSLLKRSYDRVSNRRAGSSGGKRAILPSEVDEILNHSTGPSAYTRDDRLRDQITEHYRLNLNRMIDLAHSARATVVLVTPASNLKDCSPFKSEHLASLDAERVRTFDSLYRDAQRLIDEGKAAKGLELLSQAEKIDDRFSDLHFQKGRCLYQAGRYEEAKRAFERARDEDICPLRASTKMIEITRQVGRERKVPVLDFVALMDKASEHGIPGATFFLDHVHLTVEGYRVLALALIDLLKDEGRVQLSAGWNEAAIAQVKQKVEGRIDAKEHARALLILSKVLGWAGKFEEAGRLVAQASTTLGDDPDVLYGMALRAGHAADPAEQARYLRQLLAIMPTNVKARLKMGLLLESEGKLDEAAAQYQEAVRVQPDFVEAMVNLAGVLDKQGKGQQAASAYEDALRRRPDLAKAHNNYALFLSRAGKIEQAISHFSEAIRIEPNYADAFFNLGVLEAKSGKLDAARGHFSEALRLRPELSQARAAMEQIDAMQKQAR